MGQDPFRQAEDEFYRLRGQLATGRITPEQFEAARQELVVRDSQGQEWILNANTGLWEHVESDLPPGPPPPPPLERQQPRSSSRVESRPPPVRTTRTRPAAPMPTTSPPRPRRRRSCLGGCLRCSGILLLFLIAIVAVLYFGPQLLTRVQSLGPGLRSGSCVRIVPVVTSETATGDGLICQFGLSDLVSIQRYDSSEAALRQIALYTQTQKQLLATLTETEGFIDRSRWLPEEAIYDTRALLSGAPVFTREGLLLYRERFVVQVRLSNWRDEALLDARWDTVVNNARGLIDAKFK